ncbi:hypothetical protein F9288_03820 [Sphingomonas sp. CL5.1]|nr:hypothetical protein F9288_03820 [Sphingomonas sp. CL5.1]
MRFVMVIVGGWIGARIAILWPAHGPEAAVMAIAPRAFAAVPVQPAPTGRAAPTIFRATFRHPAPIASGPSPVPDAEIEPAVALAAPARIAAAAEPVTWPGAITPGEMIGAPLPPSSRPASARPRLAGSGWLIARGTGPATPFSPQLGGSQAGARLTYALGDSRRIAIAARFSSALATRQREAALGVDWQPTALPVHLFAEQRVAIAGTRGGPSAGVIAGLPPTPVAAGFSLDAYGQAGAIARGGGEGFVDGAARVTRPVAAIGATRVELGLGAWGGAQRGAARLDIGPAASVAVPAAMPLRISLEWRQRVAGDARPGSGPALSIGADF